jgi:hypothetical protein
MKTQDFDTWGMYALATHGTPDYLRPLTEQLGEMSSPQSRTMLLYRGYPEADFQRVLTLRIAFGRLRHFAFYSRGASFFSGRLSSTS